MKVYELAKEVDSYVVSLRRYFHEHPELSTQEDKTVERICQELTEMGIEPIIVPHGGVLATIEGTAPGAGKTVLLRADIDALPVMEKDTNLCQKRACISQNPGVMHACGHDGHTAMLLGAAKILSAHKEEIPGKILLFFERDEESGSGLPHMLAYMDKHGIKADTVWGIHLYAMLEAGKVGIITGNTMSTVMMFDITIRGKGGHGSRPDQANSPVDCFVAIYNALSAARLTKITPFEPLTFSIGTIQAGAVSNVIPNDLRFGGTARLFDRELVGLPFKKEFMRIVDGICEAYGCEAIYHRFSGPAFAVYNDPECAALARTAIARELGEEVLASPEPWMASESFAGLQKLWPGVFALIGVKNEEKGVGAAHHNEYFDLDEDVLKLGVTGAVSYALEFLNNPVDTTDRQWKDSIQNLLRARGESTEEQIQGYYETV